MMRTAIGLGSASLIGIAMSSTTALASSPAGGQIQINELRIEQSGADVDEFVEFRGTPGGSLDGLTYIVIGDGDSFPPTQNGYIEAVVELSGNTMDANGYFLVAEATFTLGTPDLVTELNFEGSDNVTHLLVADFTGSLNQDLDTDDDGVLDITPWSEITDCIALLKNATPDGSSDEFFYCAEAIGPDGGFVPSMVYRCSDTDAWRIGNFEVGIDDTPGAENASCGGGGGGGEARINEYRVDQTSSDNDEYFELKGEAGTDLSDMTYIVIGDGSGGAGVIEAVVDLQGLSIGATGYFLATEATFSLSGTPDLITTLNFENSENVTHLLVRDFTGANGEDLDTDDDGTLDITPWSEVVSGIGLVQSFSDPDDLIYWDETLGPDGSYQPAHGYRCSPDGTWTIGSFYPADLLDTPGAENLPCPAVQCGGEDPRNCFEVRVDAGCSDASCCELVSAVDPACGDTEWDANCVKLAQQLCLSVNPEPEVRLSEVRMKQGGPDDDEFFEIAGDPGTSLDGVSLIVVGGGGIDLNGEIETAVNLSGFTIPSSGYFVVAEDSFSLGTADKTTDLNFNDTYNKTLLLVYNFIGTVNGDLDTNDDCSLDTTPWDSEIDGVAWLSGLDTNCFYASATAGPDGDYSPGHAYVCDVNTSTWGVGTFYADDSEAVDTPGAPNPSDCDTTDCEQCATQGLDAVGCYLLQTMQPDCCDAWDSGCSDFIAQNYVFDASAPVAVDLVEIRIDQIGDDNDEYVELQTTPGASLDGYSVVALGDGTGSGTVETYAPLFGAVANEDGLVVVADAATYTLGTPDASWAFDFENSDNLTILVVYGFGGDELTPDLDVDDDGVLDSTPWVETMSCLALIETDPAVEGELVYCTTQLGPDDIYVPGHSYFDCDLGSWQIGVFDPVGVTDTPGVLNNGCGGTICEGDLNVDGIIDGADLTILLGAWGTDNPIADLDANGSVDGADLTVLLGGWGPC